MKVVVQVSAKDSAKAWGVLVRHSPGMALRDRTFIISEDAWRDLVQAGVKAKLISRESVITEDAVSERV
ncbi:MAG TPA: hypothetical protein VGZ47_03615 [Gemmataceae bacterium]|jgi:hypothetical protein|nr:hypothetical protein [Gemmataceae bacterium]